MLQRILASIQQSTVEGVEHLERVHTPVPVRARARVWFERLLAPAPLVSAIWWVGLLFVAADSWRRMGVGSYIPRQRHILASLALYTLAASLLGIALYVVAGALRWFEARLVSRWPRAARWFVPSAVGLMALVAAYSTAFSTFSGAGIQRLAKVASYGPFVFLAVVFACAAGLAWLARHLHARLERGQWRLALLLLPLFAALALNVVWVDLNVFVALYSRLHVMLEVLALSLLTLALYLPLKLLTRRRARVLSATRLLGGASFLFTLSVVLVAPVRTWIDVSLRHVWLEPAPYVARTLERMQAIEAYLSNPVAYRGLAMSRVDRLKERYDLTTLSKAPRWDKPLSEPPELAQAIAALRKPAANYNVLIYYVDTLRYDAAADPTIMPAVNRFAKRSLNFKRAYATGSDTLRSLPGLTNGSYDLRGKKQHDLLQVSRAAKMQQAIAIPKSAHEFLGKLRPSFKLDESLVVEDYDPTRSAVWGYGADQSSAAPLVDRSLEWLQQRDSSRPFFLWLFNFDQHNWRELNESYINTMAEKYSVPESADLNWRYRVVARAIDAQFERLLQGLSQLGLEKDTIVLFVSDHGEALGRDGFWVHSIFLWESLVRVPLVLHVPGLQARSIDSAVSLVDVAPTLARYMLKNPDVSEYQGEDLVSYLLPERPPRRLPVVMAGANKDTLVRLGLINPDGGHKLVLLFEAAAPELHDLSRSDPDSVSCADDYPGLTLKMLSELVRSPLFPRSPDELIIQGH